MVNSKTKKYSKTTLQIIDDNANRYFDIALNVHIKSGKNTDDCIHDCLCLFQGFLDALCVCGEIKNEDRKIFYDEYYSFFCEGMDLYDI